MARSSVLGTATRVRPKPAEQRSTEEVRRLMEHASDVTLQLPDGSELPLPSTLVKILLASAQELAEGHEVTVLASDVQLTPAEAAKLLGLSRPFVVRLLDAGEIPAQHLPDSTHRVIRLSDVLEFQERRARRQTGRRRIVDAADAADAVDAADAADLPY
jgi:excisionase family DNA binding protein